MGPAWPSKSNPGKRGAGGDAFAVLPQAATTLTANDFLVKENERIEMGCGRAWIGLGHAAAAKRRTGVRSGDGAHTRL
jgi:hypothetical protein